MGKIFSRSEIFLIQKESTYGVIPNSSGAATVAGSDGMAAIKFKMTRSTDPIVRRDKTGSRTRTASVAGRKIGGWSCDASLVTSGTPGTVSDHDPIYASAFGADAVVTTGTVSITGATNASPIVITATAHGLSNFDVVSITGVGGNTAANAIWAVNNVTANTFELVGSVGNASYTSGGSVSKAGLYYRPVDAEPSFCCYSARVPYATAPQRVAFGCVTKDLSFKIGDDIATFSASGPARWYLDSANFANATTAERGGLTSFPNMATVVSSLVTLGSGIAGFKGRIVINGNTQARIRSATLRFGSGLEIPRDLFGTDYGDNPEADERVASCDFNMYEEDTAAQFAIEQAAADHASVDLVFQVGTTPGNTVVVVMRGVKLATPDRDDGQRAWTMDYSASQAYGSAITAANEFRLWMV